jgi:hypothetical protein
MATTKSTVVGIRLDHERRAWVEAEAARLGVSVRGLFEGMIDEARAGETESAARITAEPPSPAGGAVEVPVEDAASSSGSQDLSASGRSDTVSAASWPDAPSTSSPRSAIGSVTDVPGSLIREALSLTASLIDLSGRCAANTLGHCALTRRWTKYSL